MRYLYVGPQGRYMELTPAQMKALLQEAGAEAVADDAAEELARTLETYIGYVTEEAVVLARNDDRKTVAREDVVEAEA